MPKRIESTAQGYYHNLDPYELHDTKKTATEDYRNKGKEISKARKMRVATFFTFMKHKSKLSGGAKKIPIVPQGPHVFPHHGIYRGLVHAQKVGKLDQFSRLIPSSKEYDKIVDTEIPITHKFKARAERAKKAYAKRLERYKKLSGHYIGKKTKNLLRVRFAHVTNKLLQMHPYGTYSYKTPKTAKSSTAGKGESSNKPLKNQIDFSNAKFNDPTAAKKRNEEILDFFKNDLKLPNVE